MVFRSVLHSRYNVPIMKYSSCHLWLFLRAAVLAGNVANRIRNQLIPCSIRNASLSPFHSDYNPGCSEPHLSAHERCSIFCGSTARVIVPMLRLPRLLLLCVFTMLSSCNYMRPQWLRRPAASLPLLLS